MLQSTSRNALNTLKPSLMFTNQLGPVWQIQNQRVGLSLKATLFIWLRYPALDEKGIAGSDGATVLLMARTHSLQIGHLQFHHATLSDRTSTVVACRGPLVRPRLF